MLPIILSHGRLSDNGAMARGRLWTADEDRRIRAAAAANAAEGVDRRPVGGWSASRAPARLAVLAADLGRTYAGVDVSARHHRRSWARARRRVLDAAGWRCAECGRAGATFGCCAGPCHVAEHVPPERRAYSVTGGCLVVFTSEKGAEVGQAIGKVAATARWRLARYLVCLHALGPVLLAGPCDWETTNDDET